MSKKRVILIILGIFVVLVGAMGINVYSGIQEKGKEVAQLEVGNIDVSKVKDGVYEGAYFHDDMLGAKVKVTVKNNEITDISFLEHKYGTGKKAEVITVSVIKAQSLNVDSISGATSSSRVILKAIEDALSQ